MDWLLDVAAFALKGMIVVFAFVIVIGSIANLAQRKRHSRGELEIERLSDDLREGAEQLQLEMLDKKQRKKFVKAQKKAQKQQQAEERKRLFVIDFNGSMDAHEVDQLKREVNAIIAVAEPGEEVLVRLESGGGVVHGYVLGAAQLQRLKDAKLKLTVSVDKVAASGGYLMACVADKLYAAPFAIIGSIGVLAQLPNFHRWLQKHEVDFEQVTAGEYKRTLTMFGENTDAGRDKFKQDLEKIHQQFKAHVQQYRPNIEIEKVATGEYWTAQEAIEYGLVDSLVTSDAWLLEQSKTHDVFLIRYAPKKNLGERLGRNTGKLFQTVKNTVVKQEPF